MTQINMIACVDMLNGIGRGGKIPWSLKPDMEFFKYMTCGNVVIMGRGTWASINSKPLPNRTNVVITSSPIRDRDIPTFSNLYDAIDRYRGQTIFIIGGAQLYREAMRYVDTIYITRIDMDARCDTFFPFELLSEHVSTCSSWVRHKNTRFRFEQYYK